MSGLVRFLLVAAASLVLAVVAAPAVRGHSGQVVIVDPAVAPPGSEVSIHGDYLWTDATVTVWLVGPTAPRDAIATGMTDGRGHLELQTSLPDLRSGTYTLVVANEAGEQVETELVIRSDFPLAAFALGFFGLVALVLALATVTRGSRRRRRRVPAPSSANPQVPG